jgi:ankyrin repeat protein
LLLPHITQPDCNKQDADGRTPLHLAVEMGSFLSTERLLDKGASADVKDFAEVTPFQLAFKGRSSEIPNLLLSKKAKGLPAMKASVWRSVLPRGEDGVIMMASGESTTVNIINHGELIYYGVDRSYFLESFISDRSEWGDNMATDTPEKRIM